MDSQKLPKKINRQNCQRETGLFRKNGSLFSSFLPNTGKEDCMFETTLSQVAQNSLAVLGESKILAEAYLAGESALALHLGHRYSLDFDFFTPKHFDSQKLAKKLKKIGKFEKNQLLEDTILGVFNTVKFSLFHYPYSLIAKPKEYLGVEVADPKDIAAMKIASIVGRGNKKDFVDLYFLAHQYFFEKVFKFYNQKYKILANEIYTILKGISFFIDAEETEMPKMIKKVSWPKVKRFFEKEAVRLGKKYLSGPV